MNMTARSVLCAGLVLFGTTRCQRVEEPVAVQGQLEHLVLVPTSTRTTSEPDVELANPSVQGEILEPELSVPPPMATTPPQEPPCSKPEETPVCSSANSRATYAGGFGCRKGGCYRVPGADDGFLCKGLEAYWCPRCEVGGADMKECRAAGSGGTQRGFPEGVTFCCPKSK
jgi:hypothetical protein